ncbi:hypothetical protein [Streptomyces sp. NPDC001678]|uniref:hypothetical protein n=1 Tax=Streptomyces sp. NPDC001678 TaxID=3364599 RepID=UPI0036A6A1AE
MGILFDAYCQAWEALDRARAFLAVTGLIYPTGIATLPLYTQFTAVPAVESWPRREEATPEDTYHLYPTSPIEHPGSAASTGNTPNV